MSAAKVIRTALLVLATLRATRFVTSDFLGEWTLVGPAKRWAANHAEVPQHGSRRDEYDRYVSAVIYADREGDPVPTPPTTWGWRSKLVKGLDCPFCVGFWIGALVLLGEVTLGRIPGMRAVWRFGVAAFALNYVVGHASRRLDS